MALYLYYEYTDFKNCDRAAIADVASKVCSVFTGEPSNSLLATLEKDSLMNEISSDQFVHQMNDYEIFTFYETQKMYVKVGKRKIFPQVASMVGDPSNSIGIICSPAVVHC